MYALYTRGLRRLTFDVSPAPGQQMGCSPAPTRQGKYGKRTEHHSPQKREPKRALTVGPLWPRMPVRSGLTNTSCWVCRQNEHEGMRPVDWASAQGPLKSQLKGPHLHPVGSPLNPPCPGPNCPPGAQMHMIGSDIPLITLGYYAIFDSTAISGSCCRWWPEGGGPSFNQVWKCEVMWVTSAGTHPRTHNPFPLQERGPHSLANPALSPEAGGWLLGPTFTHSTHGVSGRNAWVWGWWIWVQWWWTLPPVQ